MLQATLFRGGSRRWQRREIRDEELLMLHASVTATETPGVGQVIAERHDVGVHAVLIGKPLEGGRVGLAQAAEKALGHTGLKRFLPSADGGGAGSNGRALRCVSFASAAPAAAKQWRETRDSMAFQQDTLPFHSLFSNTPSTFSLTELVTRGGSW